MAEQLSTQLFMDFYNNPLMKLTDFNEYIVFQRKHNIFAKTIRENKIKNIDKFFSAPINRFTLCQKASNAHIEFKVFIMHYFIVRFNIDKDYYKSHMLTIELNKCYLDEQSCNLIK